MTTFPALPSPLSVARRTLRIVPARVPATLVATSWNTVSARLPACRLPPDLAGRTVHLHLTDVPLTVALRIDPDGVRAVQPDTFDVRMSGTLAEFWLVASRQEDPDTLFFGREFAIEGDTETGLLLKNFLDALDPPWIVFTEALFGPELAERAVRLLQPLPWESALLRTGNWLFDVGDPLHRR